MLSDLLTPWFVLAAILIPLVYAERWIHSHLYGVGWLLTKDNKTATILYYVFLFPGVFVHEFVQWLVAGALNVKTKRITAWPEAQEDGTLRLDFVQILDTNRVSAAVIGAAPLVVGLALVLFISNNILNLEDFLNALTTGDLTVIGPALRELGSTPDFYLWLYIMFAVGNAMLPTPTDRQGWPLLLALFAGGIAFLVGIGTGDVLIETFTGPVAHAVDLISTAFGTVLFVEGLAIVFIGFLEEILERATKRKFDYQHSETSRKTPRHRPGANTVLPPGQARPSIYNLDLPLPNPSEAAIMKTGSRPAASAAPPDQRPEREPRTDAATPSRPDSPIPAPHRESSPQRTPPSPSTATASTQPQRKPSFASGSPDSRPDRDPSPAERSPAADRRPFDNRRPGTPDTRAPGPRQASGRSEDSDAAPTHRIPDFRRRPSEQEAQKPSSPLRSPDRPSARPSGPRRPQSPDALGTGRPFKPQTPFTTPPQPVKDDDEDDAFDDLEYVDFDDL